MILAAGTQSTGEQMSEGNEFSTRDDVQSLEDGAAVEAEIREALTNDPSRLGDVYRLTEEQRSPAEIAETLGVATVGFVYGYRAAMDAMLHGRVPNGPTLAAQIAARVRKWLKGNWSEAAREHLTSVLESLESVSADVAKVEREEEAAAKRTQEVEHQGTPGVYVYALPHYLRHPYDPETGHTLFKVGRSDVDVFSRVQDQSKRITALPEDPILLRVYEGGSGPVDEERQFHLWLESADHSRSRASRGGREWFLTSLKFLDRVASQRGLKVTEVSELGVNEV